jgi:hypothetical protein
MNDGRPTTLEDHRAVSEAIEGILHRCRSSLVPRREVDPRCPCLGEVYRIEEAVMGLCVSISSSQQPRQDIGTWRANLWLGFWLN